MTFLSAYGMDHAPAEVAIRGVELDLLRRQRLGHTILRPAWFMQNFSETFLKPVNGVIMVPTGNGSEAFIDAEDIAAVAATTLADPAAHAGAAYSLTGPQALTVSEAAALISEATGQTITHHRSGPRGLDCRRDRDRRARRVRCCASAAHRDSRVR